MTKTLSFALLVAVSAGGLVPLLAGCADEETRGPTHPMLLRVFNSNLNDPEGFPPSIRNEIDEVRVRVYQNGRERSELTRTFRFSDPSGRLPTLEFGQNYQIVVEALTNSSPFPLADGATPLFDFLRDTRLPEIQVFTSTLNSVEYASALFTSGSQVISLPSEFEGWFVAESRAEPRDTYGGQRAGHTVTSLPDGRIVVIGGARLAASGGLGRSPLAALVDTVEIYNPFTGYWTLVLNHDVDVEQGEPRPALRLSRARAFHTATLMDDGRILVAGGFESDGNNLAASSRAEVIDVTKGAIDVLGFQSEDLFDPRALHTAHWVGGKLYVIGGVGRFYDSPSYLTSIEVFDPAAGFFERARDVDTDADLNLLEGRAMHTSHALVDGILVIGGRTGAGVTPTMEFFETRSGGLTRLFGSVGESPRLGNARFGHASVLMQRDFENGTAEEPGIYIAVAGGYTAAGEGSDTLRGTALTNTLELVNERSFQPAPNLLRNMDTPRAHFALVETSITNDLLILGGTTTDNVTTTNVERFLRTEEGGFPLTRGSFDSPLHLGRAFGGAVQLETHNVMIIGGWSGGNDASACGESLNAGCTSELVNPGDLYYLGFLYGQ
jgi:hypothetical protein